MHKDIENLAEECRSCTRYVKNVKYLIPKNSDKTIATAHETGPRSAIRLRGTVRKSQRKKSTF